MSSSISVVTETPTDLQGQELKDEIVVPEVEKFEQWFSRPENAGAPLTRLERDILTLYLHAKLSRRF